MPRGAARRMPTPGARAPTRSSAMCIPPLCGREVPGTGGRFGAGAQATGATTAGAATTTVGGERKITRRETRQCR
eukprot:7515622-Pyramimonas_sp.AAC.1